MRPLPGIHCGYPCFHRNGPYFPYNYAFGRRPCECCTAEAPWIPHRCAYEGFSCPEENMDQASTARFCDFHTPGPGQHVPHYQTFSADRQDLQEEMIGNQHNRTVQQQSETLAAAQAAAPAYRPLSPEAVTTVMGQASVTVDYCSVPEDAACPVCLENHPIMRKLTTCGHLICGLCLERLVGSDLSWRHNCPQCRMAFFSPNRD